jgi:hypothetical protein
VSIYSPAQSDTRSNEFRKSLKPYICAMYTCMNTSGGLRMYNFKLRYYIWSKQPAHHGWLIRCTTVINTAGTERSASRLPR